ncbi:cytochrome P450 [Streptomyces sp. NPDC002306]
MKQKKVAVDARPKTYNYYLNRAAMGVHAMRTGKAQTLINALSNSSSEPRRTGVGVAPGRIPLVGHGLKFARRPLEFLLELPAYGDLVEINFARQRAFVVCDTDLALQVLHDSRSFDKGGPIYKALEFMGDGLVTTQSGSHQRQRRLVQPAFHPVRMPGYVSVMLSEIEAEIYSWQSGEIVDIYEAMQKLALRITARAIFPTSLLSVRDMSVLLDCMPTIVKGTYARMITPIEWVKKLPSPANRRYEEALTRTHNLVDRIIGQFTPGSDDGDVLSAIMGSVDEETGKSLENREIHDQVMNFIIAGFETTANAMAWSLQIFATHPRIGQRLQAELDEVLSGRFPELDDLPRLDYTERFVKESLRVRPQVWITTRITTCEVELAGKLLKPGTTIVVSPYLLHHSPTSFPNPEKFDPDRWLPGRAKGIPRGGMIPFGAGKRQCIGARFSMAEVTLALAAVASHWNLSAVPTQKSRLIPKMTLEPGPLPTLVSARQSLDMKNISGRR